MASSKNNIATIVENQNPNFVIGDPLQLHAFNHPSMVLVFVPLTDFNYKSWSWGIQISLGAKNKLGFIDGRIPIPDESNEDFDIWKRCDYMVTSLLLNSMSKDLVNAFIYTTNAKQL